MTTKKILFFAFAAVILLMPVYAVFSSQNALNNGKLYKFKPLTQDPFDAFRGGFLMVNYETNNIPTKFDFEEGEKAYVAIGVDKEGFAFFEEAFKSPPKKKDYLETSIDWSGIDGNLQRQIEAAMEKDDFDIESLDTRSSVRIKIPDSMSKFFINEDNALAVEKTVQKERENTYIGVRILDGEAGLDNIFVKDQTIIEYIDSQRK